VHNSTNSTIPNSIQLYGYPLSFKAKSDGNDDNYEINFEDLHKPEYNPIIDSIPLVLMGLCLFYNVRYEGS